MRLEFDLSYTIVLDNFHQIYQDLITKLPSTLQVILRKIGTNIFAANLLIENKHYNEALIILRSATESVILFCYLLQFPDKAEEYLNDCQMLRFKNQFIAYKKYKEAKTEVYMQDIVNQFPEEMLIEEQQRLFKVLTESNRKKILKKINKDDYILDEKAFDKLDKFFKNELKKPFFMKLEKMYDEILSFKTVPFELRQYLYQNYNFNSQVTHGEFFSWVNINNERKERLTTIDSSFKRIIHTIILQCREYGIGIEEEPCKIVCVEMENISDEIDNFFKHKNRLV